MAKIQASKAMVNQGLLDDVDLAKRLIMAGQVFNTKEEKILTPNQMIDDEMELYIKAKPKKYVSRGGYKLEKALDVFDVTVQGKVALDIGSSTGGFTDAFLQHGASLVYAVDVGTNQLDWKLRNDPRTVVMEQTNFRYCKPEDFQEGPVEIASCDVSFISLDLILPVLKDIILEDGDALVLIKPQFEAPQEKVGENGIIREPSVWLEVLENFLSFCEREKMSVEGIVQSPIQGTHGNREFLAHLTFGKNFHIATGSEELEKLVKI